MTTAQATAVATEVQSPSTFDITQAITDHLPLVQRLAKKAYYRFARKYELDDLVGYGHVGLVIAARQYKLSDAISFEDFAAKRILAHIKTGRDQMSTVHRKHYDLVRTGKMTKPRFQRSSDDYRLIDCLDSERRTPSSDAEFRDEVESKLAVVRVRHCTRTAGLVLARLQGKTYRQAAKSVHMTAAAAIEKCRQGFQTLGVNVANRSNENRRQAFTTFAANLIHRSETSWKLGQAVQNAVATAVRQMTTAANA